jgi:hypothetical protein
VLIFRPELLTQYDRKKVAKYCEEAGLWGRAMQHHDVVRRAKRVMLEHYREVR